MIFYDIYDFQHQDYCLRYGRCLIKASTENMKFNVKFNVKQYSA